MRCLRMESVLVVPGRDFGDALSTQGTGEGDPTEQSRLRVEYQLENMGDGGRGELAVCLGSTVTVTRERRYRAGFDDGLLYKGMLRGDLWLGRRGILAVEGAYATTSRYQCSIRRSHYMARFIDFTDHWPHTRVFSCQAADWTPRTSAAFCARIALESGKMHSPQLRWRASGSAARACGA